MNKYTELSDFEINKLVAISTGFACYYGDGSYTNGLSRRAAIVKGKNHHGNFRLGEFAPCNDPADAMPIIIESGISMVRVNNSWSARQFNNHCIEINGDNYYRIAMEVYLLMKDAENENNNNG
ncbi:MULTISPECIES: phage protein NinX family protein [unclassified Providencia]|uniref:phage protein NinX family protein n=1 Tax=unclassified Providencia TaxID=2633465 RepID=UPI0029900482|nr:MULTISPECIES: phage protein NinX family protein [unclassified Providencia]